MPTILETVDKYSWWAALNHGGLLIAPARLSEFFVEEIPALPRYLEDRLRRAVDLVRSGEDKSLTTILDTVLESILGLSKDFWQKGSSIDSAWSHQAVTGEILKPRRLWQEPNGGILPVFTTEAGIKRIGVGKGRRSVSRVIEWLRRANLKLALLTNGQQWRLIHAGADYDAWCEWDIDLWFEEGQPSLQVTALRSLLSVQSVTAVKGGVSPLLGAVEASRQGQAELSDRLGEKVRQAVELLIRETLSPSESLEINHQSIYIAANRVIMRCVVILFAEARQLLPRDNPIYNQSYSLQGLREELSRLAGGRTDALRHRYTAYPRLLALFRLVYHGCNHEALPIPHYGGGLFKPGETESSDPILQALAAFEQPKSDRLPSDAVVYRILEFLTRS